MDKLTNLYFEIVLTLRFSGLDRGYKQTNVTILLVSISFTKKFKN